MMERDLLIRRRLIGGENPANDVPPGSSAADVRQLFEAEGLDDVVEVGGGGNRKPSEEDGAGVVKVGFKPGLVGFNGVDEVGEGGDFARVWG